VNAVRGRTTHEQSHGAAGSKIYGQLSKVGGDDASCVAGERHDTANNNKIYSRRRRRIAACMRPSVAGID